MGPCWDVYAWVGADRAAVLGFIDEHVDPAAPGDPRLPAFRRLLLDECAEPGDAELVAELRFDGAASGPVTIYLQARRYAYAIVTYTAEGQFTLGLSIDDPMQTPDVEQEAQQLLETLTTRYTAAGRAGVELAPATNWAEWTDDALVQHRRGQGSAVPSETSWYLCHGERRVAELLVTEPDFPWLRAIVRRLDGFEDIGSLFAEELRLLNELADVETDEWTAAHDRIRAETRLLYPDGREVPEYLLHIDGDEAWWRWSDEPFESSS